MELEKTPMYNLQTFDEFYLNEDKDVLYCFIKLDGMYAHALNVNNNDTLEYIAAFTNVYKIKDNK